MSSLRRGYERLKERDAQVLGISTDNRPSLNQFASSLGGLPFPLLSDFYPHGQVAQAYGVFNSERGVAMRTVVIVDKAGVVRYLRTYSPGTLPTPEEVAEELDRLGR